VQSWCIDIRACVSAWCQEEESVEHIIIRWRYDEVQRVIMRNNLKELGVQELKLNGVLNIGDRAQVRIRILL